MSEIILFYLPKHYQIKGPSCYNKIYFRKISSLTTSYQEITSYMIGHVQTDCIYRIRFLRLYISACKYSFYNHWYV